MMHEPDPAHRVARWLAAFDGALSRHDIPAATALFADECYWRDFISFTWNIATQEGREAIGRMLAASLARVRPGSWRIEGAAKSSGGIAEAWFTFETAIARGKGYLRLKGDECWTLLTVMRELKGFEEKRGETRALGTQHGVVTNRRSWLEAKTQEESELGYRTQPYCIIVGGGQGGMGLGARLKCLGVPTLIVDKLERPGDAWRRRYKSLCLHDPVWYDHMPYLPFPDHWPVFTPKDKMGDWLEMYAKVMELNYWPSSECKKAVYDERAREWTVMVDRKGTTVSLQAKHLILATGMSGVPHTPDFPGKARFRGVQHHSSQHPGGDGFAGKKCVVIGSNNSAHDICADLWECGADVTMIQRSPTLVVRSETLIELSIGRLYSEAALRAGITTEIADLTVAATPYRILHQLQIPIWQKIRQKDADYYDRLSASGFMLTFGEDESGLSMMYHRRGSGYYIDVGASELIVTGRIKLRSRVGVAEIGESSVILSDGIELPADLIVYATGYGSMNGWAAQLISREVADKVGRCWGLGSATNQDPGPWEGELRNMWKPTRQEALWFHGGNLAQSRHYSLYLALQLKARMEGIPTPVYAMGEVHHAG